MICLLSLEIITSVFVTLHVKARDASASCLKSLKLAKFPRQRKFDDFKKSVKGHTEQEPSNGFYKV